MTNTTTLTSNNDNDTPLPPVDSSSAVGGGGGRSDGDSGVSSFNMSGDTISGSNTNNGPTGPMTASTITMTTTPPGIMGTTCWTHSEQGGYDYELVGISDSRYECPICLLCLRDPVLTTCGHKFCSSCIRHWVVNLGGKCPVDGVTLSPENIFPDNFTRREIMQAKAKCPYTIDGCKVVLVINELERHIHTEHSTMGGKMNGSVTASLAIAHYSGGVDVADCWFKEFGCDKRVHSSEMHRHTDEDVHHHLHLMTLAYKRLKLYSSRSNLMEHSGAGPSGSPSDTSFWRQDSRESQRPWLPDDPVDSCCDDYEFRRQRSWDSVRFAQNKHNAKIRPRTTQQQLFLPSRLAESDESLCSKTNNNCHLHPQYESQVQSSSTTAATGELSKLSALPHHHSEPQMMAASHMSDIFERLVRLEQNDREKQIKIEKLQGELASAVNLFSAATNIIKDLTARYCHGVFVWTIHDFKRLCLEMRKDPNRIKHSPGFYTDTFGYKLCLRFSLTTPTSENSSTADCPLEKDDKTFISLYVHFMKGEFDETLRWPFQGEMSLLLIHPTTPDLSIAETIVARPGSDAYLKPALPRNLTGIGFKDFCPVDKAFVDGFVKNDALICKVYAKAHHLENN